MIAAAGLALAALVGGGDQEEAGPEVRHGRIVADDLALAREGLVLSLERSEGSPIEDPLDRLHGGPDFASFRWAEVQKIPVSEDGSFRVQLPADAPNLRFVARSRFALGIHAFKVNGYADPQADALDLPLVVGGEVRVRFLFDGDVDRASRAQLVGRTVTVAGQLGWWGPAVESWPREAGMFDEPIIRSGVIDADFIVTFPRVPEVDLVFEQRSGMFRLWNEPAVAPFCLPQGLRMRPLPGQSKTFDVRLRAGDSLSGRVVSAKGEPVAGAQVRTGSSLGTRATDEVRSAVTDADGRFTLLGLARRPETIFFSCEGYVSRAAYLDDLVEEDEQSNVRLVVQPCLSLNVGVLTPDGRPAGGLLLRLTQPGLRTFGTATARTDDHGIARIQGLGHAPLDIRGAGYLFEDDGSSPARVLSLQGVARRSRAAASGRMLACHASAVDAAAGTLEIRLAPAARIRGTIAGIDPERGTVRAEVAPASPHSSWSRWYLARVGPPRVHPITGEFSVQLPPGRYRLAASQTPWGQGRSRGADVSTIRTRSPVT